MQRVGAYIAPLAFARRAGVQRSFTVVPDAPAGRDRRMQRPSYPYVSCPDSKRLP